MMKTYIKQRRKPTSNEDQNRRLSSTDIASHDDLLTEILLRLPIRSLLRSKCVSKHWRSLISTTRFALIRNPNPNPPLGLFLQKSTPTSFEYDFVPFVNEYKTNKPPFKTLAFNDLHTVVLHSVNGLMLCYSLRVEKKHVYNAMYYVYNPTINMVVTLPELECFGLVQRRPLGMTLLFEPLKSSYFKVVCVRAVLERDSLYYAEVYSSENGKWSRAGEEFGNESDTEFMCGVYWNDAVHWINKKGYVFYFKIGEERVDRVATPIVRDRWNVKKHCYPLVVGRDCLLFIDIFPPLNMEFDVHEMNRDYSGWSVKYHVDLNPVMTKFPVSTKVAQSLGFIGPLPSFVIHCLVSGEKEKDMYIVLEIPGKAIRYNIVLNTCQELCDLDLCHPSRFSVGDDGFSKVGRWPGAFLFYESLSHV